MAFAAPTAPAKAGAVHVTLLLFLVSLLVASRLWGLDYQAFHHDESIHSKAIWDLARQGPSVYKYDPVYHGPFFYHLGALTSVWLPDTDYTARLPFALSGILLVSAALLLAPIAGWRVALLVMALLTLSPTVTYYSRFAREDVVMTALLAWMIGAGALYLFTRRLRWLTIAWLCIVLGYCTKENSYINGFLACAFVVVLGAWCVIRNGRAGLHTVFVGYLPLTRLMILFGFFSFFTFFFVAIDARVGPHTSLWMGMRDIARHSVALTPEVSEAAEVLRGEEGYFTAPGRDNARRLFLLLALAAPVLAMSIAEFVSARMRGMRLSAAGACGCIALAGYSVVAIWLTRFFQWGASHSGEWFLRDLRHQLVIGWLLLSFLALLSAIPILFLWNTGVGRRPGLVRLLRPRLLALWTLAFQVTAAIGTYCYLFSSMGTNAPEGLRDGLYDYVAYWFRQQTGDFRIWGEWWYYLPRLALYETAALVAIFFCCVRFNRARSTANSPTRILTLFAFWLSAGTIIVYAFLNEKVGWLAIYQAYALNLLAALLIAHWWATASRGWRAYIAGPVLAAAIVFTSWQHALAVHLYPDSPTEPMAFVTTSRSYLEEVKRIEQAHWSAVKAGTEPPMVTLSGEGTWPGAWYLRRMRTAPTPFVRGATVQIIDDTRENRRRLEDSSDFVWDMRSVWIRGWWFSRAEGLPGGGSLAANIAALLMNVTNDHRDAFGSHQPMPDVYTDRFATQLLRFVLFREIWYPPTGMPVLFAWHTDEPFEREGIPVWLDGLDREPREAPVVARFDGAGTMLQPRALCLLEDGSIAIADSGNGRICILDRSGDITQVIGEGILSTDITGPCGLAVGPDGTLYVTDTWNHAIRAFSRDGELVATCDAISLEGAADRLFGPRGVTVMTLNGETRVYMTDTGNNRIIVLDAELTPLMTWGYPGIGPTLFDEPVGIVADGEGSIFVADTGNGRIQQFDPAGLYIREFPVYMPEDHERLSAEPQLTLLPDGERIAMTYATRGVFVVISPHEERAWPWAPAGMDTEPSGIAFSPDWDLFLSDRKSGAVLLLSEEDQRQ